MFAGGNTPPNKYSSRGSAFLTCLKFDKSCSMLGQLMLTDNNATAVTCLKRCSSPLCTNANSTMLLVGCMKGLFLVQYDSSAFIKHLYVPQIHTNIVLDMSIYNNMVVSIARNDESVTITEFDVPL